MATGPLPKFKFNPTLLKPLEYDLPSLLGISFKFYEAQRSGMLPKDNKVKWRGNSFVRDGSQVRGPKKLRIVQERQRAAAPPCQSSAASHLLSLVRVITLALTRPRVCAGHQRQHDWPRPRRRMV